MAIYIHERPDWPAFKWDDGMLLTQIASIRNMQGRLSAYLEFLGFESRTETLLQNLTVETMKSGEIEGVVLNPAQVRSSIARKLGLDIAGLVPSDRFVDGVVEMMIDATQNYKKPLTEERLFGWHAALFPTGRSGMEKINTGKYRDGKKGPMQVVSGIIGREKIHFEAPDAKKVKSEMKTFLKWFNTENTIDPVLKAAIAHFWFVTIHPFEDGNGRIARAIADMQLARADENNFRYYSMSAQIRIERKKYYEVLETSQKGKLDITYWLIWFMRCLAAALDKTDDSLRNVLQKTWFWDKHTHLEVNERQRLIINKLFDGFTGNLTSSKWAKICKCSHDTALRDIKDLVEKKILRQLEGGGRSTCYVLKKN